MSQTKFSPGLSDAHARTSPVAHHFVGIGSEWKSEHDDFSGRARVVAAPARPPGRKKKKIPPELQGEIKRDQMRRLLLHLPKRLGISSRFIYAFVAGETSEGEEEQEQQLGAGDGGLDSAHLRTPFAMTFL